MLSPRQDAYGRLVFDYFHGLRPVELVERDDGWLAPSGGPAMYFAAFPKWPRHQRQAMAFVHGRVLDIGCGAGRAALHLQTRGHPVLAVDNSPLAIRTARLRGVRQAQVRSITGLTSALGRFDTLLLLGNNFGLVGSRTRARWLLGRFRSLTGPTGRIVAEILDPYDTADPAHLQYHRRNHRRGRMGGQVRIRVRYKDLATPWFDYLFVSRRELQGILRGTGWRIERVIPSSGPTYVAILTKTH